MGHKPYSQDELDSLEHAAQILIRDGDANPVHRVVLHLITDLRATRAALPGSYICDVIEDAIRDEARNTPKSEGGPFNAMLERPWSDVMDWLGGVAPVRELEEFEEPS